MNLIRYQAPELSNWPTLDRWSNLRDELNSLEIIASALESFTT